MKSSHNQRLIFVDFTLLLHIVGSQSKLTQVESNGLRILQK